MSAQVAEAGSREQGVADRVCCDVSVGVPGEAGLTRPEQARKVQRPAITVRMNIRAHAYLRKRA